MVPIAATPLYLVYAGTALEGLVYRIVDCCPPSLDQFLSYEALGKPYDKKRFVRANGVSMFADSDSARAAARRYRLGRAIATLDIRAAEIVWSRTGGRGHLTVWAPAAMLLDRVVQCDEHE